MARFTVGGAALLVGGLLLVAGSCGGRKGGEQAHGDAARAEGNRRGVAVRPRPGPRNGVKTGGFFSPAIFDELLSRKEKRLPIFAEIEAAIPKVAKACHASKKRLNLMSSCEQWRKLRKRVDGIYGAVDGRDPGTLRKAFAVSLAAVSRLRDGDPWTQLCALAILERRFYRLHGKKVTKNRGGLARAVAYAYRHGRAYELRYKALGVLGSEGGTNGFHGDRRDVRVLVFAMRDESHWVRQRAADLLSYALDKHVGDALVTPAKIAGWLAHERDGSTRESLAVLASQKKMTDTVFAVCAKRFAANAMCFSCARAIRAVMSKATFGRHMAMAGSILKDPKLRAGRMMAYPLESFGIAAARGIYPRDKVFAFYDRVITASRTATQQSDRVYHHIINAMTRLSSTRAEIEAAIRFFERHVKGLAKALPEGEDKEDTIELIEDGIKGLRAKLNKTRSR